jgi:nucleoside-diphosphate-sugar epimerase
MPERPEGPECENSFIVSQPSQGQAAKLVREWPPTLILGATGFIGSWVTKSFSERGARNTLLGIRRASPRLAAVPLECVHCDIMDMAALRSSMRGIEVVVNCVRDHTEGATIKATRLLLAAAKAEGVKRIVQFSSVAVYGNANGVVTENDQDLQLIVTERKKPRRKIYVRTPQGRV